MSASFSLSSSFLLHPPPSFFLSPASSLLFLPPAHHFVGALNRTSRAQGMWARNILQNETDVVPVARNGDSSKQKTWGKSLALITFSIPTKKKGWILIFSKDPADSTVCVYKSNSLLISELMLEDMLCVVHVETFRAEPSGGHMPFGVLKRSVFYSWCPCFIHEPWRATGPWGSIFPYILGCCLHAWQPPSPVSQWRSEPQTPNLDTVTGQGQG